MRKCASALSVTVLSVLVFFYHDVMCQEDGEANLVDAALVESDIEVLDSMEERFQPLIPHQSSETELKILAEVNVLRATHHSAPLIIDGDLADSAQGWADHLAGEGRLIPSCSTNRCCYGENLAITGPSNDMYIALNITVDYWYRQVDDYDYKKMKARPDTSAGAFTALVWRGSKRLGIGTAVSKKDKKIFIVFQFAPTGNMEGDYKRNVREPTSYENSDIYEIEETISTSPTTTTTTTTTTTKPTTTTTTTKPTTTTTTTKPTTTTTTTKKPTTTTTTTTTTTPPPTTTTEPPTTTTTPAPTTTPAKAEEQAKEPVTAKVAIVNTTTDNADDKLSDRWQIRVLKKINEYRAKHRSPPLELDEEMTERAQNWSDVLAAKGALQSSCTQYCRYGENIGQGPKNKDMGDGVNFLVKYWYEKLKNYNYTAGKGNGTGGFTQLVWKGSKKVGIGGAARLPDGAIFAVVQFFPTGNTVGSYKANVQDPAGPSAYELAGDPLPTNATMERKKHVFRCASKDPCVHGSHKTGNFTELQIMALEYINELRARHGVDPVCLDPNLNENSMIWSESQAAIGKLDLSCIGNDCCYGEIQAARSPNDNMTAEVKAAITAWYSEIKHYDFKTGLPNNPTKMVTGFTALVWKESKKVGIGAFVKLSNEVIYAVLEFWPPGNTRGMYRSNVMPLKA